MRVRKLLPAFVLSLSSVSFVFIIARHIPLGNAIPIKQDSAVLNEVFQDIEAAFVVTDRNKNQYIRYNPSRCQQRFSPYSTFKIPNSLIALETGVIKNENVVVAYDRDRH